jgi:hypothetical protein
MSTVLNSSAAEVKAAQAFEIKQRVGQIRGHLTTGFRANQNMGVIEGNTRWNGDAARPVANHIDTLVAKKSNARVCGAQVYSDCDRWHVFNLSVNAV